MRTVRAYVFCSAKGGVGKSTLAVTTAQILANRGYRCVVLDGDFTGTSLADGLRLCAPRVRKLPTEMLDLTASPTGRYLTWVETRKGRSERAQVLDKDPSREPWAIPYLNDALTFLPATSADECRLDAMLWQAEGAADSLGRLHYLPSSSTRPDLYRALGWHQGQEMEDRILRLRQILLTLVTQVKDLTDIVIDLPPGMAGFTQNFLQALHAITTPKAEGENLSRDIDPPAIRWHLIPFIVTSQDRNDLQVALEYFIQFKQYLPGLVPLVNRRLGEEQSEIRQWVDGRFPIYSPSGNLKFLDMYQRTLGRLFRDERLELPSDIDSLASTLHIPEAI